MKNLPLTNSPLPIKYHLTFTKQSNKWYLANNSANGKWEMDNGFAGDMV